MKEAQRNPELMRDVMKVSLTAILLTAKRSPTRSDAKTNSRPVYPRNSDLTSDLHNISVELILQSAVRASPWFSFRRDARDLGQGSDQ